MEFFRIRRDIPFMRYALVFNLISALTFAAAVFFLVTRGLHLSNEFTGGTVLEVSYAQSADLARVRAVVEKMGFGDVQVQNFGTSRDVMIRLPVSKDAKPQELAARVFTQLCSAENGTVAERQYTTPQGEQVSRQACQAGSTEPLTLSRTEFVGPSVGEELVWDGGKALIFVVLGIMGYLAIRFEKKFAVAAIIANLHDVVIILGFFAFFQWEFSLSVLAAVLAVLGYSVNESVVIFDRIREAFRKFRKMNTHEVIDHAITSTMSRTIITHGSTQMMVLSMLLFGGPTLHYFAVALTIGILFGIYSSVFVAAAIAMWLGVSRDDLVKGGGTGTKDSDPNDPNAGAVV
ncbi:protein translocase subunit SecF [Ideonella dechloratans]|uniref:Protein-export membrane protein SecF n=1 Tax=Ideonella dechloratans TaxID=36863 RepID=A0A643FD14_IDEDE|nr:protein translocase subunit SecF [Ideonella dechloratans]KAB0583410.1 protein translocase subunit SecF [Ideonella dechloratans]UFU09656.1 protein translocase subunit SecF [Ideonella dechloratans]